MFREMSLCTLLEYYLIMIHSKFHSILPKNGQENGTETRLLAEKCIMEKTHLKFCYVYINNINNAGITPKDAFSV